MRIHCPFSIAEAARISGGRLLVQHEHRCASRQTHDDTDCGCRPTFRLWKTPPARKGGRGR
jgi:hypothetical protein